MLQEPAFMLIQYLYAVVTMLPCTLWFYNPVLSGLFVSLVGLWSIYNGATFYSKLYPFNSDNKQTRTVANSFEQSMYLANASSANWSN